MLYLFFKDNGTGIKELETTCCANKTTLKLFIFKILYNARVSTIN